MREFLRLELENSGISIDEISEEIVQDILKNNPTGIKPGSAGLYAAEERWRGNNSREGYFILEESGNIEFVMGDHSNGFYDLIIAAAEGSGFHSESHGQYDSGSAAKIEEGSEEYQEVLNFHGVNSLDEIGPMIHYQEADEHGQGEIESIPQSHAANFLIGVMEEEFENEDARDGVRISFQVAPFEEVVISSYFESGLKEKEDRIRELVENNDWKGGITLSTSKVSIRMGTSL